MVGCELPELMQPETEESHDWEFSQAFIDSFRWRSAESKFGATGKSLQEIWNRYSTYLGEDSQVDELIRPGLTQWYAGVSTSNIAGMHLS